jgi:hypothetical protein
MARRLLAVGVVLLAAPAFAQEPLDLPACYYSEAPGTAKQARLANGVTAEVRRSDDADATEEACTLRVTDATGRVALSRTAFNARVMPATGNDLDGDGVVDAVLSVDDGGGNRCCWNTIVVTLSSPPRVRAEVPEPLGWQFDPVRKRFVAEEILAFYQLGPDMASSPVALRFHRLGAAGFEDVTGDYCADLLDPLGRGPFSRDDDRALLTPARMAAARAGTGDAFTNEQTGLAAIAMALQYHVCGRPKNADALLNEAFPPAVAAGMRDRVAAAVSSYRPK